MTAFVTDTFTGTNGTLLTAHTADSGATWAALTGSAVTPTIQSNKLDPGSGVTQNALFYASTAPNSADYSATTRIVLGANTSVVTGPGVRLSTSAQTGYFGFVLTNNTTAEVTVYKYVAGALTQIATLPGVPALTGGASYDQTLDASGTTLKLWIRRVSDGFYLTSAAAWQSGVADCITATDSSISAAGRAGFWQAEQSTANASLIDSFSADQASGAATAVTMSGPSGGVNGVASTNFTIGANGTITGTVVVTPSSGGGGGTFTPTTVSISSGTPTGTFTYTPASTGAKTISVTNNGSLTNPANITYTVTAATIYNTVNTTDTIGAQNIMVLVPNSSAGVPYNSANPTNVILYAHGAGEDQTGLTTDSLKFTVRDALINAGYILAGTNARNDNWGNQASVDDYAALDKYVRDNYNVKNVCIWSQSMGGLDGLSAIAQGKIKVVGWLGTYPVCNLANLYALGGFTGAINTAYGITGVGIATYANKTWGNDPALKQGFNWRHIPMRFYASSGDTVVPKANNTDVLAALVAGSCRESTVVACTGNHGDPSHFDATSYLAFFARCFAKPVAQGQPATTKTASVTLVDTAGALRPSLTGLKWSWSDQATPDLSEYPTDKGTGATTNAAGVFSITVKTNLAAAATGWLVVTDSDGTTAQSPVAKAFSGPVAVA